MEKNLVRAGRIFLSLVFIFSALTKLISLNFFDTLVGNLFLGEDLFAHTTGMFWVQIFTRLIIAGELVLGAALLQEKWFKKVVIPFVLFLLVLFTAHLFYEGFRQGDFVTGNCGCFGEVLPMTILESIIKNVVSMLVALYVWKKYKEGNQGFASWVNPVMFGLICFGTTLFLVKKYEKFDASTTPKFPVVEQQLTDTQIRKNKIKELLDGNDFESALTELEALEQEDTSNVNDDYLNRLRTIVEIQKNNQ